MKRWLAVGVVLATVVAVPVGLWLAIICEGPCVVVSGRGFVGRYPFSSVDVLVIGAAMWLAMVGASSAVALAVRIKRRPRP